MSNTDDRRSRKRLATRQSISDAATLLFLERGFDGVTVDEIAAAADVGRMTVFNYFPRKEDMFFDREDEGRDLLLAALRGRAAGVPPLEALRLLAHKVIAGRAPYVNFSPEGQAFVRTIEASETLKARARAIRGELAAALAEGLCESVGKPRGDADAALAANLLLAVWTTAFLEAHRVFRQKRSERAARAAFLAIVDKGSAGVAAALAGTPYAG